MATSLGIFPNSGPLQLHKPVQVGRESERTHQDSSRKSVAAHHHPLVLEPYERGNHLFSQGFGHNENCCQKRSIGRAANHAGGSGDQGGWIWRRDWDLNPGWGISPLTL